MGRILELSADENDFVFLLRARATSQDARRREFLDEKITEMRREKGALAEMQPVHEDRAARQMEYLLDPLCIFVHVSLLVPTLRENSRTFCHAIGITPERYREVLRKLADAGHIELEEGKDRVVRILNSRIHYGPTHPLTRAHQSQLRTMSHARLSQIPETAKSSIMLTFAADEATRNRINERLDAFLKEVQQMVIAAKDDHVYQLCLDLFRWA